MSGKNSDADALVKIIDLLGNVTDPTILSTIGQVVNMRILQTSSVESDQKTNRSKNTVPRHGGSRVRGGGTINKRPAGYRKPRKPKPDSEKGCIHGDACYRKNDLDNPCPYNHDIKFTTNRRCRHGNECEKPDCPFVHPDGWDPNSYDDDSDDNNDNFTIHSSAVSASARMTVEGIEAEASAEASAVAVAAVADGHESEELKMDVDENGNVNWGD